VGGAILVGGAALGAVAVDDAELAVGDADLRDLIGPARARGHAAAAGARIADAAPWGHQIGNLSQVAGRRADRVGLPRCVLPTAAGRQRENKPRLSHLHPRSSPAKSVRTPRASPGHAPGVNSNAPERTDENSVVEKLQV